MRLRQRRNLYLHSNAYANSAAMMGIHLCAGLRSSIVKRHLLMAMNCWGGIKTVCGTRIDHSPNAASHKLKQKGKDQGPECATHESIIRSKNLTINNLSPRIFLLVRLVVLCISLRE
jgi:hypothetical protein